MKKLLSVLLAGALMVTASAVFANAASSTEPFTNFDSLTSFEEGCDIVDKADITADQFKDYYAGAYDWDTVLSSKVALELVDGVGADGTKGLKLTKSDARENAWVELYANPANGIKTSYPDAKYLIAWVDFTNVEFRKACFGVISKDHTLYRTDEIDDSTDTAFYIYQNGAWVTLMHGDDGCFGSAQDTPVKGFCGYAAVPLANFVSWDSQDAPFDAATTEIEGVFFYFDYESDDDLGKSFYFDNIGFVADYTDFDANAFAVPVVPEESSEEPSSEIPAEESSAPVTEESSKAPAEQSSPASSAAPSTPVTADAGTMGAILLIVLSASVLVFIRKRCR